MAPSRSRVATSSRQRAASRSPGENRCTRSRPDAFAAYIAESASLSRPCASVDPCSATATPMLADSGTARPSAGKGAVKELCSRNASAADSEASTSRARTRNWSPASRAPGDPAAGAPGPHLPHEPVGDLAQQRVADLVAQGVVHGLETVEIQV